MSDNWQSSAPTDQQLNRALEQIAAAIGSEHVDTSAEGIAEHQDLFALNDPNEGLAAAVLYPGSVEDVQAIVRIANEHRVPLWTVSTGRNLAFGGSAARTPGALTVKLTRMNRVLEVNEDLAYAEIEPGVRFFDLAEHLRDGGYNLWTQIPSLGWGSVTGNALERGMGRGAYGDHFHQVCGMEVVLGTGEVVRTGMGGMTNSKTWHLYKGGYGPSLEGLFSQSNYGIVTKIGLWLMPIPESYRICTAKFQRDEDLAPLIDIVGELRIDGTMDGQPAVANAVRVARAMSHRSEWTDGKVWLPSARIPEAMERFNVGWWNLTFGLHGRDSLVEERWKIVEEALKQIPGAEIESTKYAGNATEEEVARPHHTLASKPNIDGWSITNWAGTPGGERGAIVDYAPVLPIDGATVLAHSQEVGKRIEEWGFDYGGSFMWGPRHILNLCAIAYDRDDREEAARARDLCRLLIEEASADGFGVYRTHVDMMDLVADQLDFNDHALRDLQQSIKGALDPNGILSPGKQGIWPPESD